uniref:Uncharacterized protein n=1 Tax=Picea glauca TaxID=3330 RepID=A0A101M5P7_PICGL|nr:hypothetical protein ABT39_MTgene1194 [Picea glauca]
MLPLIQWLNNLGQTSFIVYLIPQTNNSPYPRFELDRSYFIMIRYYVHQQIRSNYVYEN